MLAVGFDLGETLIHYKDTPLSWKSLYEKALLDMAESMQFCLREDSLSLAEEILTRYNTRINPRTVEVSADTIFTEILTAWGVSPEEHMETAKKAFFKFFQKSASPYDDVLCTLRFLKEKGIGTGVLTDVPYGMDREMVMLDLQAVLPFIDVVLTSVECGMRKPHTRGYTDLAAMLGVLPSHMVYVGNEQKDIEGANASGMYSVLVDRTGSCPPMGEKLKIESLSELPAALINIAPVLKASKADIPGIMDLISACVKHMELSGIFQWNTDYPNLKVISEDVESGCLYMIKNGFGYVAIVALNEIQPEEYAGIRWQHSSDRSIVVHRLAVHPSFQGMGAAKKLMLHAEQLARGLRLPSIRLDTYSSNKKAVSLYERLGYSMTGQVYFPGRELPFFCMEKTLR